MPYPESSVLAVPCSSKRGLFGNGDGEDCSALYPSSSRRRSIGQHVSVVKVRKDVVSILRFSAVHYGTLNLPVKKLGARCVRETRGHDITIFSDHLNSLTCKFAVGGPHITLPVLDSVARLFTVQHTGMASPREPVRGSCVEPGFFRAVTKTFVLPAEF